MYERMTGAEAEKIIQANIELWRRALGDKLLELLLGTSPTPSGDRSVLLATPRANAVREVDAVLEAFTGASLSDLVGRYLSSGHREPAAEPTAAGPDE